MRLVEEVDGAGYGPDAPRWGGAVEYDQAAAVPSGRAWDATPGGSIYGGGLVLLESSAPAPYAAPVQGVPAAVAPSVNPNGSGVGVGGTVVPSASPTGGDAILGRLADLFAATFGGAAGEYRTGGSSAPLVLVGGGGAAAGGGDAGPSVGRAVLGLVVIAAVIAAAVVAYRKLRPRAAGVLRAVQDVA
jgi:hypothetical protein